MPLEKHIHQIWASFAFMVFGMLICVIIKPHGLTVNDGISYYGTFKTTVLPYAVSLLSLAWLLLITSRLVTYYPFWLHIAFEIFCIATIGVLLTPYTFSNLFSNIHIAFGSLLFAGQLVVTGALAIRVRKNYLLYILWSLELLAGILCAIFVFAAKGFLFEWQIAFQTFFVCFLLLYDREVKGISKNMVKA